MHHDSISSLKKLVQIVGTFQLFELFMDLNTNHSNLRVSSVVNQTVLEHSNLSKSSILLNILHEFGTSPVNILMQFILLLKTIDYLDGTEIHGFLHNLEVVIDSVLLGVNWRREKVSPLGSPKLTYW